MCIGWIIAAIENGKNGEASYEKLIKNRHEMYIDKGTIQKATLFKHSTLKMPGTSLFLMSACCCKYVDKDSYLFESLF